MRPTAPDALLVRATELEDLTRWERAELGRCAATMRQSSNSFHRTMGWIDGLSLLLSSSTGR